MAEQQHPSSSDGEGGAFSKNGSSRGMKKSSSGEDVGPTKKRGRPRMDTEDATGADRRRTQIRLAQRAYRQRKETTISSLQKRVAELEGALGQMNQTYMKFNSSVIASGIASLRPELGRDLNVTTEAFEQIARDAARNADLDNDEAEFEEPAAPKRKRVTAHQPSSTICTMPEQDRVDSGYGHSRASQGRDVQVQQRDTVSSYLYGLSSDSQAPRYHRSVPYQQGNLLPFGMLSNGQPTNDQTSTISGPLSSVPSLIDRTFPSPFTYSFQETTFGRQLQRYAIERAFHLLSSKDFRRPRYEKVFRLSLLTHTHEQMLARFRSLLLRREMETLDFWQVPFIHIGGAGTHFPRRDAAGNLVPVPNGWTIRSTGPLSNKGLLVDSIGRPQGFEVNLQDFEGEFFDAHDVQGYLETKGCFIDPSKSFAEVLMDDEPTMPTPDTTAPFAMGLAETRTLPIEMPWESQIDTRGDSSYRSVDSSTSLSPPSAARTNSNGSEPQTPSHSLASSEVNYDPSTISYGDSTSQPVGFDLDTYDHSQILYDLSFPSNPMQRKRQITIDVQKLCDELINRAFCLGRGPGFRPHDVDVAFTASIISAV